MTQLFSDDFESGNLAAWTTQSGNYSVQSGVKLHGSYAAKFHVNSSTSTSYAIKQVSGQPPLFVCGYFRFDSMPGTGQDLGLFGIQNESGSVAQVFFIDNGETKQVKFVEHYPQMVATYANFEFAAGVWYCIELGFRKHASAGEYRLWINGTEIVTRTGLDTSGAGTVNKAAIGTIYAGTDMDLYVDSLVVADTRVGDWASRSGSDVVPAYGAQNLGTIGAPWSQTTALSFLVGNDAYIKDVDWGNFIGIQGVYDATTGGIVFGSGKDTNLYRPSDKTNTLKTDDDFIVGSTLYVNSVAPRSGNTVNVFGNIAVSNANVWNSLTVSGMVDSKENFYIPTSYANWLDYMAEDDEGVTPFPEAVGKFRFSNITQGQPAAFTDMIGGLWRKEYGFPQTAPFILARHHLVVKKDFFCKGQVVSMEGCLTMYGGYAGWIIGEGGYNTYNPIVMLAQASDSETEPKKNKLEIRMAYNHGFGGIKAGLIEGGCTSATTGSGDAFKVGDGCFLVDIDFENRIGVQGAQDRNQGGFRIGYNGPWLWRDGGYLRTDSPFVCDGTLTVGTPVYDAILGPLYLNASHQIGFYSSSARFKDNVKDAEDCSWLFNLRPVTFDWKDPQRRQTEGKQIGLIAEEVNEQCPQLVFVNGDGKPEGVHYEWLGVPLLIEVKKLRKRVEALETNLGKTRQ
ncbi:MAG: tail fiber domain-containing protein [Candidatus Bathyarchaeia archaeon]